MPAHRKQGPTPEDLKRLYVDEGLTMRQIGAMYELTQTPIRNRLVEAGIDIRPKHKVTGGFQSPEHERKLRESRRGQNSHWWRGGTSTEVMRYRASKEWRELRLKVYERDGWLCNECGVRCLNTRDSKKYPTRKIQCHHVVPRRDGGPDHPDNLITLCMSCHHKIERREARTKE